MSPNVNVIEPKVGQVWQYGRTKWIVESVVDGSARLRPQGPGGAAYPWVWVRHYFEIATLISDVPPRPPQGGTWPPKAGSVWRHACGVECTFTGDALMATCGEFKAAIPRDRNPDRWTFVRTESPPTETAMPHECPGPGCRMCHPAKPARVRDTYASLMAKLHASEGTKMCDTCKVKPATTHSGRCDGCSWGDRGRVNVYNSEWPQRLLPARPEPWKCSIDDADLLGVDV